MKTHYQRHLINRIMLLLGPHLKYNCRLAFMASPVHVIIL